MILMDNLLLPLPCGDCSAKQYYSKKGYSSKSSLISNLWRYAWNFYRIVPPPISKSSCLLGPIHYEVIFSHACHRRSLKKINVVDANVGGSLPPHVKMLRLELHSAYNSFECCQSWVDATTWRSCPLNSRGTVHPLGTQHGGDALSRSIYLNMWRLLSSKRKITLLCTRQCVGCDEHLLVSNIMDHMLTILKYPDKKTTRMCAFSLLRLMCISMVHWDWTMARTPRNHFEWAVISL